MATQFDDYAADASAAVDDVFGEAFAYQPMAPDGGDRNKRPVVDPARAAMTITAALIEIYARAGSGPARTQGVTAEYPGFASNRPQISFDAGQLPYAVKRGDRLTQVATGKTFQIAEPRHDTGPRVTCDVNQIAPS